MLLISNWILVSILNQAEFNKLSGNLGFTEIEIAPLKPRLSRNLPQLWFSSSLRIIYLHNQKTRSGKLCSCVGLNLTVQKSFLIVKNKDEGNGLKTIPQDPLWKRSQRLYNFRGYEFNDIYPNIFFLENSFFENWGSEMGHRADISLLRNNNSSESGFPSALLSTTR